LPSVGLMRKEVAGKYGGRQATRSIAVLRGPGTDAICFFHPPPCQDIPLFRTQGQASFNILPPMCKSRERNTQIECANSDDGNSWMVKWMDDITRWLHGWMGEKSKQV
jgi:hypothetical protein